MDPTGKLIYTRNNAVLSANLQTISDITIADGNRIPLAIKELGTTEIFANAINHSPNGRFVTVVGDGEYIVYTSLAWRNKAFGNGSSFAWAGDSNTYAVLEGRTKVRVYKNFRERTTAPMKGAGSWALDGLHGGPLLGARGSGVVVFWDWETGEVVRRIDVDAKNVGAASLRVQFCCLTWGFVDLLVWHRRTRGYLFGRLVLCPSVRPRRVQRAVGAG